MTSATIRIAKDYVTRLEADAKELLRVEAENERLRAMLEHIVQISDHGATAEQIGVYAVDAADAASPGRW